MNLLRAVSVFCSLLIIYFVAATVMVLINTGSLTINSPDKNSNIVISETGHQALDVGTGSSVGVRLKPGTYQVFAFDSGKQSNAVVTISKGGSQTLKLKPLASVMLPTLSGVNFIGFNQLVDHGMQASQVTHLEMGIFKFSPFSNPISLETNSLNFPSTGPDDPSTYSNVYFNVLIGSKTYAVSCSYDNLSPAINLALYNPGSSTPVYQFND